MILITSPALILAAIQFALVFPLHRAGIHGARVSKNLSSFKNIDIDIVQQMSGVKLANVNTVRLQGALIGV